MNKAIHALRCFMDWRFLPAKFQDWLFKRGTNAVEFISGVGLLGFFFVFLIDGGDLYNSPLYYKFKQIDEWAILLVFLLTSLCQFASMTWKTIRGTATSGYILLWSSLVWFLISVAFYSAYPPLNTGMILPPVLSFICLLAGRNLITFAIKLDKHKRDK